MVPAAAAAPRRQRTSAARPLSLAAAACRRTCGNRLGRKAGGAPSRGGGGGHVGSPLGSACREPATNGERSLSAEPAAAAGSPDGVLATGRGGGTGAGTPARRGTPAGDGANGGGGGGGESSLEDGLRRVRLTGGVSGLFLGGDRALATAGAGSGDGDEDGDDTGGGSAGRVCSSTLSPSSRRSHSVKFVRGRSMMVGAAFQRMVVSRSVAALGDGSDDEAGDAGDGGECGDLVGPQSAAGPTPARKIRDIQLPLTANGTGSI